MEHNSGMSSEMTAKIDKILASVKEPESQLSVAELGLVKKVTYSRNYNRIIIKTDFNPPRRTCIVCGLITAAIQRTIIRMLEQEFSNEFPDLVITVE